MEKMMTKLRLLLLCLSATYAAAAAPGSCVGRCGEVFTRGQQCTCDFSCLQHKECCPDFLATCTTTPSCRGRCSETFRRGRTCDCDPLCVQYNTCCQDFQLHCDAAVSVPHHGGPQTLRTTGSKNRNPDRSRHSSNSESEERYTGRGGRCPQYPGGQCSGRFGPTNPLPTGSLGSNPPAVPGDGNTAVGPLPGQVSTSLGGTHQLSAVHLPRPSNGAPVLDGRVPVGSSTNGAGDGKLNVHLVIAPGGLNPSGPSQGGPAQPRPSTLLDVAQALGLSVGQRVPEGPGTGLMSNADLCSGSPINGLTALGNGTVLIFKGELFWAVDSVGGSIGPPQNIRDTLGVSSPIDTVFTRMDCSGNTYVIKGNQCWRLDENLMVKPGYPKPLTSEFPGLTGPISAALVVPATRNRLETIFFFKPGDIMQRFTVLPGSSASCRDKPKSSTLKNFAQQAAADVLLSGEINIKVSLTGFPSPVTSALSMPAPQSTNPYQLFVFSGPLYFRVQITGDLPVLVKPDPPASLTPLPNPVLSPLVMATNPANPAGQNQNPAHPTNSIRFWLRCP
ncbi:proteoglycan 4a isoform X1 [Poecilia latipinna]|uniref:proteoglycan 4a isoform X1 n=1 Tax=Poecilia latipinna TaxID=48699 RepID=UPI00072DF950|nr:PREDICTED: proteoglycan 4 isoform X1 [Poecilia latipinna]